jgi:hypothetical protein
MFRFSIRDVLWLTVVVALVVVWRADLARQEAEYRDRLRLRMGNNTSEYRLILHVANNHPELRTELIALDAENGKHLSDRASLYYRFGKLVKKAEDFYRMDAGKDPNAFDEEPNN